LNQIFLGGREKKEKTIQLKLPLSRGGRIRAEVAYIPCHGKYSIEDFELYSLLGKGAFNEMILKVKKKDSGQFYEMKILDKANVAGAGMKDFLINESLSHRRLHHPFIVSLRFAFQSEKKLYFVVDFMSRGDMYDHLNECQAYSENVTLIYAAEILLAISYLHEEGFIYRDLKPENIFFDEVL